VGEIIQDPAAGTGGFLIAARRYVIPNEDAIFKLTKEQNYFQRYHAFVGMELIGITHRLAVMNLMLHGIDTGVTLGDTLGPDGADLGKADVILTNPPFNKFPEQVARADFSITASGRKGPLPFVEHVVRSLRPGGRAAMVVPDNVLFDDTTGRELRRWVMELCDLHTILRLPTGIFYSQGVKTNVLFLTRGQSDRANTKGVWVYDLRANMPAFGKTHPLNREDFERFEAAFGDDPHGRSRRNDEGEEGRFRRFSREEIAGRNDNLDVSWLRDDSAAEDELVEPEDIAAAIIGHLKAALNEVDAVSDELEGQETTSPEVAA